MFWSWLNLFAWDSNSVLTDRQIRELQKRNERKVQEEKREAERIRNEKALGDKVSDKEIEDLARSTIRELKLYANQGTLNRWHKYYIGEFEFQQENGVDVKVTKDVAKFWPEAVAKAVMARMGTHFPSHRLELDCYTKDHQIQCRILVDMKK